MTTADENIFETIVSALRGSADHLRTLVAGLDDSAVAGPSYAKEWSIADVLSHLGSGAVITQRRLDDVIAGAETPEDFAPSVWDEWNAKSPANQAADGMAADQRLVARLEALDPSSVSGLRFALGPIELDLAGFVGLRLNEHVMHTWDVAVVADPTATLPPDAAGLVVDNLAMIARFTGRPTGTDRTIAVRTIDPVRAFEVTLAPDAATLSSVDPGGDESTDTDLVIPAEAFARLVYGRLDAAHTPTVEDSGGVLDELRQVYPGP